MPVFYDDNKRLIAADVDGLQVYFNSLPGVSKVVNQPFSLPCPMTALFKVVASAALPKFIYAGFPIDSNRIYPRLMPSGNMDFSALCNGVNKNNIVAPPVIGSIISDTISVPVPVIGTIITADANTHILAISGSGGWVVNPDYSSAMNVQGEVTLNLSVSKLASAAAYVDTTIAVISGKGIPKNNVAIYGTDDPNLPIGSILFIDTNGVIKYTGNATNTSSFPTTTYIEIFAVKYNING